MHPPIELELLKNLSLQNTKFYRTSESAGQVHM